MLFDLDLFIAKLRGGEEVIVEFLRPGDDDLLLPCYFVILELLFVFRLYFTGDFASFPSIIGVFIDDVLATIEDIIEKRRRGLQSLYVSRLSVPYLLEHFDKER